METSNISANYNSITEAPGIGASEQQLSMLYTRYRFAARFCQNKDVLEVACGTGQGLGYLATQAKKVVGGDIDPCNVEIAKKQYKDRDSIQVVSIDAHHLPFENNTFDVLILYEAIYYFEQPKKFLMEAKRVLRKGGTLIICSANKEWPDFNPSPFSKKYFSATELVDLLEKFGFKAESKAAYPVDTGSLKAYLISLIKQTAVRFHLVPKTMKGKEFLKRIFFGKLAPLPSEINDMMAPYYEPQSIRHGEVVSHHKVIYVLGYLS